MAEFGIEAEDLKRLARLVEENGLSELLLVEGDLHVKMRTASYRSAFGPIAAAAGVAIAAVPEAGAASDAAPDVTFPIAPAAPAPSSGLLRVEAPIMGVFYRSSVPDEPPFVDLGDVVEIGQPVGVIEAMKVFSEVLSDHAGRVREIPAKNGGLVQPGDALVVLEAI